MKIEDTLKERGNVHGDYTQASIWADGVKMTMTKTHNWMEMHPHERQALQVIVDKMSRILYGNPHFQDHWHDIIGYARLVEKTLEHDETLQELQ